MGQREKRKVTGRPLILYSFTMCVLAGGLKVKVQGVCCLSLSPKSLERLQSKQVGKLIDGDCGTPSRGPGQEPLEA